MATTVHIQGLAKSFPSPEGGTTFAVDRVDLTINAGELFFLLGPSGCGKTTLLRMIAGFIDPTAGSIAFEEGGARADVTFLAPNKRNTGMVFQSYALWPHMTVEANVAFGLGVRKVPRDERARRVAEALAQVHMEAYAARKPNQLSGGQQQRVALARALVVRPRVLLLDEPLSNLDAKLRHDLHAEIRRICKASGTTGVYVTHDQKEALSMADRIAIMRAGKVVQVGTPTAMYRRPADRFVAEFLGETNLLEGAIVGAADGVCSVEFAGGCLASRTGDAAPPVGSKALVSLRPEAIRLSPAWAPAGENAIPATIVESTFLGEVAQHVVEIKGGPRLKVAQLNPAGAGATPQGAVRIEIAPEDVVVLPAADAGRGSS